MRVTHDDGSFNYSKNKIVKLKIKKMYLLSGERASFVVISSSVLLAVDCTVCVAVRIQIGERCAVGASSTADRSQQLSVLSNQPGQITVHTVDGIYDKKFK